MVRATINGKSHEFKDNYTILEAASSLGIEVPTLCHDERLKPAGVCWLCVVEVKGWSHPAICCHTQHTGGTVIETETEELRAERTGILSLLVHRYPSAWQLRYGFSDRFRFLLIIFKTQIAGIN